MDSPAAFPCSNALGCVFRRLVCTSFLGSAASRRLVAPPPPPDTGPRGPTRAGLSAPCLRPFPTTFYRHLKQVNEALKHIWTAEPTDKQAQQRDYVLKHLLALNRPCLFVDQVQAHSGAAMRNNSESISELLFVGIKKVIELATPAHGRPTNEQSAQSMSLETGLQASRPAATMRWWETRQGRQSCSNAGSALTTSTHLLCLTRARAWHRLSWGWGLNVY